MDMDSGNPSDQPASSTYTPNTSEVTMVTGTVVELHVTDFEPIRNYYGRLGFEIVWEREPEGAKGYLVMKMGRNVLCFWAGNESAYKRGYFKNFPEETPRGYGVEIVIMVDGVEAFYNRVQSHANVVHELEFRPWGAMDFRAVDPEGFYLRFSEAYDVLDSRFSVP
jgi:predicted enzyme related to lactoylglutathione lyase